MYVVIGIKRLPKKRDNGAKSMGPIGAVSDVRTSTIRVTDKILLHCKPDTGASLGILISMVIPAPDARRTDLTVRRAKVSRNMLQF